MKSVEIDVIIKTGENEFRIPIHTAKELYEGLKSLFEGPEKEPTIKLEASSVAITCNPPEVLVPNYVYSPPIDTITPYPPDPGRISIT